MQVEHIIFDLDNTLYPSTSQMDEEITRRMLEQVAGFFHCTIQEAKEIKRNHIQNYSTTLEWLIDEGLTDAEGFLRHVHPADEADYIEYNPELRPFLQSLPQKKTICTNSPIEHARRVLEKLNVTDCFENISDIRSMHFKGKPYASAFFDTLSLCGGTIENTIFVDDTIKYTDGFMAIGGTSILLGDKNGKPLNPESPAFYKATPPHPGRTIRAENIFSLPDILKNL